MNILGLHRDKYVIIISRAVKNVCSTAWILKYPALSKVRWYLTPTLPTPWPAAKTNDLCVHAPGSPSAGSSSGRCRCPRQSAGPRASPGSPGLWTWARTSGALCATRDAYMRNPSGRTCSASSWHAAARCSSPPHGRWRPRTGYSRGRRTLAATSLDSDSGSTRIKGKTQFFLWG